MNNLDKPVEISTQITYGLYSKFYLFTIFRGRFYKHVPALFYIISIFAILISLLTGSAFGFDSIIVILLIVLLIMDLLMTFLFFISPRIYYNSVKKLIEAPVKYTFTDTYLLVESESSAASNNTQINYDTIYKVCETNNMIYIFINNSQAYIIPKRECSNRDIDRLRMIFSNHIKKYRNYSRWSLIIELIWLAVLMHKLLKKVPDVISIWNFKTKLLYI